MSFDYRTLTLSAMRSTIAYLNSVDIDRLRLTSKDDTNILYYVFKDVLLTPKYYYDAKTDATAYTWIQNRTLHIVFRGTESVDDVKIDVDTLRVPLFLDNKHILVHKGFLTQSRSLEAELYKEILSQLENVDIIHFCGHSLGAALATLASGLFSNFLKIHGKRIVCHTIGSSRLGNKAYVDWYEGRVDESVRILNFKDPVPLLPISATYYHINGGLELFDDGTIKTIIKDRSWFMRFICLPFNIYYRNPLSHHACALYVNRLAKLASWDINTTLD